MSTSSAGADAPDAAAVTQDGDPQAAGRRLRKLEAAVEHEQVVEASAHSAVDAADRKVQRAKEHLRGAEEALKNARDDAKDASQRLERARTELDEVS